MTRQTRREPGAGPRRSYVVLAAIALAAAVLSIGTPAAEAASSGDLVGTGRGAQIEGTVDGGPVLGYWAGEMRLRIDGGTEVTAWCIDLHTSIDVASGSDLEEVDWVTSGIRDLDRVSFVLHTYDADDPTLPGSPDERAAGIQAAIWHLTDGFELASAVVHAGRAFAKLDESGRPVVQRLILATESVAEARATAWVDVTVPETTTTTVPETTTTTTVPATTTTTTTVPETTTTTVPTEVLGIVVERGELPRTGGGATAPLLAVGVTAVLAGTILLAGTRRRPTTR